MPMPPVKPLPVIVTLVLPASSPVFGVMPVSVTGPLPPSYAKPSVLNAAPFALLTCTSTGPHAVPAGSVTVIAASVTLCTTPSSVPNTTLGSSMPSSKPEPAIVIVEPPVIDPVEGLTDVIFTLPLLFVLTPQASSVAANAATENP